MPASLLTVTPLTASGVSYVGFNPSSLTGLILWLDASRILGVASGASLSVWTDSSASASHATQPSAASQPTFVLSGQNGLSYVSFNGNGQCLLSTTSMLAAMTIAMAGSCDTNGTGNMGFISGQTSVGAGILRHAGTPTKYGMYAGLSVDVSSATQNAWVNIVGIMSSAGTISVSGVTAAGNTGVSVDKTASVGVFLTNSWLSGAIGEVAIWNRNISEAERVTVQSYLKDRWNTL